MHNSLIFARFRPFSLTNYCQFTETRYTTLRDPTEYFNWFGDACFEARNCYVCTTLINKCATFFPDNMKCVSRQLSSRVTGSGGCKNHVESVSSIKRAVNLHLVYWQCLMIENGCLKGLHMVIGIGIWSILIQVWRCLPI